MSTFWKHRRLTGGVLTALIFAGGLLASQTGTSAVVTASHTATKAHTVSVATGATSCKGTKTTLVLFIHYNSFETQYYKLLASGFEAKNPCVTIREDIVPAAEEYTKFATLVAGGDTPNIYVDYDGYGVLSMGELAPIELSGPRGLKGAARKRVRLTRRIQ